MIGKKAIFLISVLLVFIIGTLFWWFNRVNELPTPPINTPTQIVQLPVTPTNTPQPDPTKIPTLLPTPTTGQPATVTPLPTPDSSFPFSTPTKTPTATFTMSSCSGIRGGDWYRIKAGDSLWSIWQTHYCNVPFDVWLKDTLEMNDWIGDPNLIHPTGETGHSLWLVEYWVGE